MSGKKSSMLKVFFFKFKLSIIKLPVRRYAYADGIILIFDSFLKIEKLDKKIKKLVIKIKEKT